MRRYSGARARWLTRSSTARKNATKMQVASTGSENSDVLASSWRSMSLPSFDRGGLLRCRFEVAAEPHQVGDQRHDLALGIRAGLALLREVRDHGRGLGLVVGLRVDQLLLCVGRAELPEHVHLLDRDARF